MHVLRTQGGSVYGEARHAYPADEGAAVEDTERDTVPIPRHATGRKKQSPPRANEISDFAAGMITVVCAILIFALGMILGATIW